MDNEQKPIPVLKEHYVPTAEFYSQIIDSLQDYSIFTVDIDLNINSWNSGATKIFNYETDEIIGKPFDIIFSEIDKKNGVPAAEISLALKKGRSDDVRWHVRKDNSTFYADGLVFPLKSADNKIIGYVKILKDITARKASEDAIKKYAQELEELNSHKETVLSILSHDLRSPLAGIIQGAEYLKDNFEKLPPDFTKKLLDEFHAATLNELNMLDYLVEWARIKYASDAFVPSQIALEPVVKKVFDTLKETAAIHSIVLNSTVDDFKSVFADEKMLLSILQNLLSNAIKHSNEGGKITLSAKKDHDMMVIKVKDTGVGMSKKTQETLFAPHIKSLSKAVEENKGAGIGLLLVKGFLEKSGGSIWVESEIGKGATFYFSLPLSMPLDTGSVLEKKETLAFH